MTTAHRQRGMDFWQISAESYGYRGYAEFPLYTYT